MRAHRNRKPPPAAPPDKTTSPPHGDVNELTAFCGAALQAIEEFCRPPNENDELVVVEDCEPPPHPEHAQLRPVDALASALKKITPYPGQEG